jgi:hypothetical protein
MPTQTINLNNSTPAAPAGSLNVEWQADTPTLDPTVVRNVSAYFSKFTGDTGAGGAMGLVPAPAAGDAAAGKVLKADGTWYVPPSTPLPSGAANQVIATPDGAAGVATLRALVAADLLGGGGGGMTNPMTAQGDLIVGGASGAAARLAAGTSGQVLQTNGSSAAPSWVTPSGGGGGGGTASMVLPLTNGDTPGPGIMADGDGQCIGVPLGSSRAGSSMTTYLAAGLAADLPASPNTASGAVGCYLATDTGKFFFYINSAWTQTN